LCWWCSRRCSMGLVLRQGSTRRGPTAMYQTDQRKICCHASRHRSSASHLAFTTAFWHAGSSRLQTWRRWTGTSKAGTSRAGQWTEHSSFCGLAGAFTQRVIRPFISAPHPRLRVGECTECAAITQPEWRCGGCGVKDAGHVLATLGLCQHQTAWSRQQQRGE
jgi:hypothetical protein